MDTTLTFPTWLAISSTLADYARLADACQPTELAELFTTDGTLVQYRTGRDEIASVARGRNELTEAFRALEQFETTSHVLGQIQIELVDDGLARTHSYCMAHHITARPEGRVRYTMACRYSDTLALVDGRWLFQERVKFNDWTETHPLKL